MPKLSGGRELLVHPDVLGFYRKVLAKFRPASGQRVALFLPCSAGKPYSKSRTHKAIKKALSSGLGDKVNSIEEFIVSEPMAIVPRRWEHEYPAAYYDMKLDSWFPIDKLPKLRKEGVGNDILIARNRRKINRKDVLYIKGILVDRISRILLKLRGRYKFYVAYLRGAHREVFLKACRKAGISPVFLPTKRAVLEVVDKKGTFYYIMNGMRNDIILEELVNALKEKLN